MNELSEKYLLEYWNINYGNNELEKVKNELKIKIEKIYKFLEKYFNN